jgi:hypothetical protein
MTRRHFGLTPARYPEQNGERLPDAKGTIDVRELVELRGRETVAGIVRHRGAEPLLVDDLPSFFRDSPPMVERLKGGGVRATHFPAEVSDLSLRHRPARLTPTPRKSVSARRPHLTYLIAGAILGIGMFILGLLILLPREADVRPPAPAAVHSWRLA